MRTTRETMLTDGITIPPSELDWDEHVNEWINLTKGLLGGLRYLEQADAHFRYGKLT